MDAVNNMNLHSGKLKVIFELSVEINNNIIIIIKQLHLMCESVVIEKDTYIIKCKVSFK